MVAHIAFSNHIVHLARIDRIFHFSSLARSNCESYPDIPSRRGASHDAGQDKNAK